MRNEDLEGAHEMRKRLALVISPLLQLLGAVDEDDEVILLALVVDLALSCFTANHLECLFWKGG